MLIGLAAGAAAVVVAALVLVIRGSSGDGVTVAPDGVSADILDGALLTADEVGGGYREAGRLNTFSSSGSSGFPEGFEEGCPGAALLEQDGAGKDEGRAVEFTRGRDSAKVVHALSFVRAGDPGFDEVAEALEDCTAVDVTAPDGTSAVMSVQAEAVDGIGEGALAMRLRIRSEDERAYEMFNITSARGGVYSNVGSTTPTNPDLDGGVTVERSPDRDLVRRLAVAADEKIQLGIE